MLQWLFDLTLARPGPLPRLAHRVRHRLTRAWNPEVRWAFEGRTLTVPLSHDFAWNRGLFPDYTDNLRRVAAFLRARDGTVGYIDVGANVGDTYLLTRPAPGDRALLVEGAARYFGMLVRNVGRDPGVTCVRALLADRERAAAGGIVYEGGNARVDPAVSSGDAFETLDGVLARHPGAVRPTLVKVDVDGYDGLVLRGARRLLAAHAPVVMFEHHARLIDALGDEPAAVFADLAELGYGALLVYDNFGALLGTLDPRDAQGIARLIETARVRDGYYHDLIAFPERRAADREAFLVAERARA
jgi:FkbM family methyltransferase